MSVADLAIFLFIAVIYTLHRMRRSRMAIACSVTLAFLAHLIISDYAQRLDGFLYYSTAAISDAIAIALIANLEPKTKVAVDVCRILLLMMCINLYGWVIYEFYAPPYTYNFLMAAAYLLLAARILITTRRDRGDRRLKNNLWTAVFYRPNS